MEKITPETTENRRIVALDGFRGLMTIVVVISHFFAEVPHGIAALMMGWLAVDAFFVLSGFLIGRLILEKARHRNFFAVFYTRRICRTFPIYFVCVIAVFYIDSAMNPPTLHDYGANFPLWSYLGFVQNFFMSATGTIGQHWLSPTWTLAVEEQFYLLVPAVMIFCPRRYLVHVLAVLVVLAVASRSYILATGITHEFAARVSLLANSDVLVAGIIAALALKTWNIDWQRMDQVLRWTPLALFAAAICVGLTAGRHSVTFAALSQPLVAAGFALMIMSLVRGAPEAVRYESKTLCFFGNISYAVYLTHLAVLGMMHHVFLGATPDIETAHQLLVTMAALPVTVAVSWVLTKLVEEPITRLGRRIKWSRDTVGRNIHARSVGRSTA